MEKKFYISDLHLFHNCLVLPRGFVDVDEMHAKIEEAWKEKVSDDDTVYILGDLGMYHVEEITDFISSLPGKKILITGNRDKWNLRNQELRDCFKEIHFYHYPIEDWSGMVLGNYHLHGHVHKESDEIAVMKKRPFLSCNEYRRQS